MGLIVIGSNRRSLFAKSLVSLLRFSFRLDGAQAETYQRYVLGLGKSLIDHLSVLESRVLVENCKSEVKERKRRFGHLLKDVNVEDFCRDSESIRDEIKKYIHETELWTHCAVDDF